MIPNFLTAFMKEATRRKEKETVTKDWRAPINIAKRDAAEAAVLAEIDGWDACDKARKDPPKHVIQHATGGVTKRDPWTDHPIEAGIVLKPKMLDVFGYDKVAAREKLWRTQGPGELRRLVPYMKSAGVLPEIVAHAEQVLLDMEQEVAHKYGVK